MTVHNGHMLEAEATPTHPITVAIERRTDPARSVEATSWMQAGTDLAARFDGYLGSGWVRTGEQSDLWYMLYRFRDLDTLEAWERSDQRSWWLDSGRVFAREVRIERRTGIEGWFDAPLASSVEAFAAADILAPVETDPVALPIPAAPPAWKQAVTIWLGFFPVNLVGSWLLLMVPTFADWPLSLRVGVSTLIFTPIMVFWVLPWVTRMLRPWLPRPNRQRG